VTAKDGPETSFISFITQTIFSTGVYTITTHDQATTSTGKYPVYTTTYPVTGSSSKSASSTDVVSVNHIYSSVSYETLPKSSSVQYAPVYPSSLSSAVSKPVSVDPIHPSASTSYKPSLSTPYAAQFTGSAERIGMSGFALVVTVVIAILA
jgi:hypothetical protein